jgi:uncharacterized protein (UPF0335 family)
MTKNVENLIDEHLRHIRGRVDRISEDMSDLKHRMSSLESAMVLVKREVSAGDETSARQQVSLDRLLDRIERLERRLEVVGN